MDHDALQGALVLAARHGHCNVVQLFFTLDNKIIDINGDNFNNPLAVAVEHIDVVKLFLSHPQIDVNVGNPLVSFIIMTDQQKQTEHLDVFRLLLSDKRTDVNAGRGYVFRSAVSYGRTDIVRILLNDPRITDVNCEEVLFGYSTLMMCVQHGYTDMLSLLLEDHRIDFCAKNFGVLRVAMAHRGITAFQKLLEYANIKLGIAEKYLVFEKIKDNLDLLQHDVLQQEDFRQQIVLFVVSNPFLLNQIAPDERLYLFVCAEFLKMEAEAVEKVIISIRKTQGLRDSYVNLVLSAIVLRHTVFLQDQMNDKLKNLENKQKKWP